VTRYLSYFDNQAFKRVADRKRHSYYWNDITNYINYFAHEDSSVLEIGCGTGELLNQIKGKNKTGIDFSSNMVSIAKQQFPSENFYVMEAEKINLESKFDLIIISNLIGFTDDIQKIFEQLATVTHEHSKIIVTYYNSAWEPLLKFTEAIGLKTKTPIQNWLTTNDIKNLLYLSGHEVYREHRRLLIPFYIPLLSKLFNLIIAKLPFIRRLCLNNFIFAKPASSFNSELIGDKHSVSIIIPARNESGNIENALLRLPRFGKYQEIIFVEGNSTDDTWDVINETAIKYGDKHKIIIAKQEGKGKNDAVKKGFSLATGDILMILDADLTVPPEDLPKFYNAISSNKGDFINGCRLVYPMDKQAMRFLNMLGNRFFSVAFSWLLDQPFKDTLCGTKVIFRSDYAKLEKNRTFFGNFDPFGDFDLLFGAYKLNLKIVEIPIRYRERTYGETNISRFKHGLILLKMCFFAAKKIKFR